jgi:hypothetical protein
MSGWWNDRSQRARAYVTTDGALQIETPTEDGRVRLTEFAPEVAIELAGELGAYHGGKRSDEPARSPETPAPGPSEQLSGDINAPATLDFRRLVSAMGRQIERERTERARAEAQPWLFRCAVPACESMFRHNGPEDDCSFDLETGLCSQLVVAGWMPVTVDLRIDRPDKGFCDAFLTGCAWLCPQCVAAYLTIRSPGHLRTPKHSVTRPSTLQGTPANPAPKARKRGKSRPVRAKTRKR